MIDRKLSANSGGNSSKTFFICYLCPFVSVSKETVVKHINAHKSQKTFTWTIGDRKFITKALPKTHSSTPVTFKCNHCDASFQKEAERTAHHKIHFNYPCIGCSKIFCSEEQLATHIASHPKYICDVCTKEYDSQFFLDSHKKIHSKNYQRFACNLCNREYESQSLLDWHKKQHSKSCQKCHIRFDSMSQLDDHMTFHVDEVVDCGSCGTQFGNKLELNVHLKDSHGIYSCLMCSEQFDKGSFTGHLEKYFVVQSHVCAFCNKGFKSADDLSTHEQEVHPKITPDLGIVSRVSTKAVPENLYSCSLCSYASKFKITILNHVRTHCLREKFGCNKCDNVFGDEIQYRSHLKFHQKIYCDDCNEKLKGTKIGSRNDQSCAVCDAKEPIGVHSEHAEFRNLKCERCHRFLFRESFSKNHISSNPQDLVQCELCKSKFNHVLLLVLHAKESHNAYCCKSCGQLFISEGLLESHMESHFGIYPFVCNICNKRSYQHSKLLVNHKNACKLGVKDIQVKKTTTKVEKIPVEAQSTVVEVEKTPMEVENTTAEAQNIPVEVERTPMEVENTPVEVERLPMEVESTTFAVTEATTAVKETPIVIESIPSETSESQLQQNFDCVCGQIFPDKYKLNKHKKETQHFHVQCPVCNRYFSRKDNLTSHMKTHSDQKYQCHICQKKFFQKRSLGKHLQDSHKIGGQTPPVQHECHICERKFIQAMYLERHLQTVHNPNAKRRIITVPYIKPDANIEKEDVQ